MIQRSAARGPQILIVSYGRPAIQERAVIRSYTGKMLQLYLSVFPYSIVLAQSWK